VNERDYTLRKLSKKSGGKPPDFKVIFYEVMEPMKKYLRSTAEERSDRFPG
jgi:hypothetical protein